jgi:hypothetical protein
VALIVVLLLIVVALAAWFIIDGYWQRRFMAKLGEIRATGEPATWEEVLAARPDIPDEENAARLHMAAAAALDAAELPPMMELLTEPGMEPDLGVRRSPRLRAIAAERLEAEAEGVSIMREAGKLKRAAYPIDAEETPWDPWQPDLIDLRFAVRTCVDHAELHAEAGRFHEAVLNIDAAYAAGGSLGAEPLFHTRLMRLGIQGMAAAGLERVLALGELASEDMTRLDAMFAADEDAEFVRGGLIAQRACMTALPLQGVPGIDAGEKLRARVALLVYRLTPGRRWIDGLYHLDFMEQYLAVFDLPYPQQVAAKEALRESVMADWRENGQPNVVSVVHIPAEARALDEVLIHRARLRVARAALAVERWRKAQGNWPESLQEMADDELPEVLTDALTGAPLGFRRVDGGFRLYSVGPDGSDNGGITEQEMMDGQWLDGFTENSDIVFRLLDPERRAASERTFAEEILAAYDRSQLENRGLDAAKLKAMGLSDQDLRSLGFEIPAMSETATTDSPRGHGGHGGRQQRKRDDATITTVQLPKPFSTSCPLCRGAGQPSSLLFSVFLHCPP